MRLRILERELLAILKEKAGSRYDALKEIYQEDDR